jgi:hypothetical protein
MILAAPAQCHSPPPPVLPLEALERHCLLELKGAAIVSGWDNSSWPCGGPAGEAAGIWTGITCATTGRRVTEMWAAHHHSMTLSLTLCSELFHCT